VPKKYDPHVAAPLVFVFHGGGGWGDGMRAITLNKFERIADDEGQIIVYPDGLMYTSPTTGRKERHWNDNRLTTGTEFPHVDRTDDAGFVRELVNTLGNILTVDKRRIYATGLSNGGMFSLRLACELSDIIAAVASVAGCAIPEKTYQCIPREPVSVMLIESVDDPMVPYKGGSLPNNRGDVVAVESVLDKWVRNNGCEPAAQVKLLPRLFRDGTTVTQYTYINGKQDTETVLYKLTGAGHTWPGGKDFKALNLIGKIRKNTDIQLGVTSKNIDATKAIMEFFSRHSKIKGSDLNNQ
jgi:polyhydroxybutyrate depolymerase